MLGGKSGDVRLTLDSASAEGPSPMQALAFALAGCMAMDVVHVLRRAATTCAACGPIWTASGCRRSPRRFTRIALHYTITGNMPAEPIERAIQLSRDKYCSVWHSMRQDIELDDLVHRVGRACSSGRGWASEPDGSPRRREYLDWLRGVAVLLMIEAHLFDSWTAAPDRDSRAFGVLMMRRRRGAPRCS